VTAQQDSRGGPPRSTLLS